MRASRGRGRIIAAATSLAVCLGLGPPAAAPAPVSEEGTVVAVDGARDLLVVANDDGDTRELDVDIATPIVDDRGRPAALDDLQEGDRLVYTFEIAEGGWTETVIEIRWKAHPRLATSAAP